MQCTKYHRGFSYIEVLLATSLSLILMVTLIHADMLSIQTARESLYQSMAMNEINNGVVIKALDSMAFSDWKLSIKNKFPKGDGGINGNEIYVQWRSFGLIVWRCDHPKMNFYSCLSENFSDVSKS